MQKAVVFLFVALLLRSVQFTIQTKPGSSSFMYINYDMDAFHRLRRNKISSIAVNSTEDCAMACLKHWECLSFNLATQMTAEKYKCELIRTDKYNSNSTYSNTSNFHHFFVRNPCGAGKQFCRNGGTCCPGEGDSSFQCVCAHGFNGRHCEDKGTKKADSCLKWLQHGYNKSDTYKIVIPVSELQSGSATAYCDMTTDGGGWLVFLRRKDGTVEFDRLGAEYRNGFGDLRGEFWYSLDYLHRLTQHVDHELRVDLEDWEGNTTYAKYTTFKVGSYDEGFRLTVGGYSGTAGDSFSRANGMNFTTEDSDQDDNDSGNCAVQTKAGWWFKNCFRALLTGRYRTPQSNDGGGIIWPDWKGFHYPLKSCEMKIRP